MISWVKYWDPIGENIPPYFQYNKKGKWSQVNDVDWRRYLDDGSDEGINCSQFRNKSLVQKVNRHLKELKNSKNLNQRKYASCPVDKKRMVAQITKYGELSPWPINPKGISAYPKRYFKILYRTDKKRLVRQYLGKL